MRITRTLLAASLALAALTAHADGADYRNPVDGRTYPGPFKTYEPETRAPREGRVNLEDIRLLTDQHVIAQRTTVEQVAAFVEQAKAVARRTLAGSPAKAMVLVQFNCTSMGCEVRLAHQGKVAEDVLKSAYDAFAAIPALKTTGLVSFQVSFSVSAP